MSPSDAPRHGEHTLTACHRPTLHLVKGVERDRRQKRLLSTSVHVSGPATASRFCHLTAASDAPFAPTHEWVGARLHPRDPLFTGQASKPHAARRRLPSTDPQAHTNGPRLPAVTGLLGLRRATQPTGTLACLQTARFHEQSGRFKRGQCLVKPRDSETGLITRLPAPSSRDGSLLKTSPRTDLARTPHVVYLRPRSARRRADHNQAYRPTPNGFMGRAPSPLTRVTGGPPRALFREKERTPLHPRCLPPRRPPCGGGSLDARR